MTEEIEWISPAAAARQVGDGLGIFDAQFTILSWIAQERVRCKALEVIRYDWTPPPPVEPVRSSAFDGQDGSQSRKGYSSEEAAIVHNIGMPVSWATAPLERSERTEVEMTIDDWGLVVLANRPISADLWTISEMTVPLVTSPHPNARVVYSGIRFARQDIVRRMQVAGFDAASATATLEPVAAIERAEEQAPRVHDDEQRRQWMTEQPMMSADAALREYKKHPLYDGTKQPEWRPEWAKVKGTRQGRQPKS